LSSLSVAYRLWNGISTPSSLGPIFNNFESDNYLSVDATYEVAAKLRIPPLLALFMNRPELMQLFDIVDSDGRVLHRSQRDYGRVVIVLNYAPPSTAADEPAEAGLAGYMRYLLEKRGPVLTPKYLEKSGSSQKSVAFALSGIPPSPALLLAMSRALNLNPIETTRLISEAALMRDISVHQKYGFRRLITMSRGLGRDLKAANESERKLWQDRLKKTAQLNNQIMQATPAKSLKLYHGYIKEMAELWGKSGL
jgi:hypothetical protein